MRGGGGRLGRGMEKQRKEVWMEGGERGVLEGKRREHLKRKEREG